MAEETMGDAALIRAANALRSEDGGTLSVRLRIAALLEARAALAASPEPVHDPGQGLQGETPGISGHDDDQSATQAEPGAPAARKLLIDAICLQLDMRDEREIIELNAQEIADIVLSHRGAPVTQPRFPEQAVEGDREWIIELIRNEYDAAPNWPHVPDWDDGAERIADQILTRLSATATQPRSPEQAMEDNRLWLLANKHASENAYLKTEVERLREALCRVIQAYDTYRARGVMPAPAQYAQVVEAIEAARAALAASPESKLVECDQCGGTGFDTPGTGYGNVCSKCGGQRELPAEPGAGGEWQPIETSPTVPVQVELFFGRIADTGIVEPYRDERRSMAYWDGECFREMGTGHRVCEFEDDPDFYPTHWRPLPPPPLAAAPQAQEGHNAG